MQPAEWIALITPGMACLGAGIAGVVKLTRMTVALEQIGENLARVLGQVDNHEHRITMLEVEQPGKHRRVL